MAEAETWSARPSDDEVVSALRQLDQRVRQTYLPRRCYSRRAAAPSMARKKRRGRPANPHARRRQTTRAGRRGENTQDRGSTALRQRKHRLLAGREDLELSGAAVLLAHDQIDRQQYDTLGLITDWLQRSARAWGCHDGSPAGRWRAILAAASTGRQSGSITVPPGADAARRQLDKLVRHLNGSHDLVLALADQGLPPLVARVIEHRLTQADRLQLEQLRWGLDRFSGRR